ncbi:MAG: diaminobutyrate acetyltransferase [Rhizobiaceae bacterium]|nr:diaminobutyrate acetyltransferase [Rhizobiaceae bacterium]
MQIDVIPHTEQQKKEPKLALRSPNAEDGADIWQLIRSCGPLDDNSMYCNLLQCDHFAETCVVAEIDSNIVGWISAYILPSDPETLFVWQVAVAEKARGMGVAKKMLLDLVSRQCCDDVTRLKTTITKKNDASWALFRAFADRMDAPLEHDAHFIRDDHFGGNHDTEYMVTVGAFGARESAAA